MKHEDRILREQVMSELGDVVAEELEEGRTGEGQKAISAKVSPLALDHLTRTGREAGLSMSEMIRLGLAQWLRSHHKARRKALERVGEHMADVPDHVLRQAGELFAQLPTGEIRDREPIQVKTGSRGEIMVHVDRTGAEYGLFQGHAIRLASTGEGIAGLTFFLGGHVVDKRPVRLPVPAGVARG